MPLSILKRHAIRRYLLALLHSDLVAQDAACSVGNLWTNCDGEPAPILDHESHQIAEDVEGALDTSPDSAAISFKLNRVNYNMLRARAEKSEINLQIDIIAFGQSGEVRTDICDQIEERILYRLLSQAEFTDAQTGETLVAFIRQIDENGYQIESRDDQSFDGNYTIRELSLNFTMTECLSKPACSDVAICFDFKDLTRLDKDA